ncbi:hypothetical protein AKO1_004275 [Acrasis kona]|uniref:thymine dioxygenase n=1 Tax=Acrasis kona TaxID=1008807 RepID=A0AAW2Z6Z7_9EUKA
MKKRPFRECKSKHQSKLLKSDDDVTKSLKGDDDVKHQHGRFASPRGLQENTPDGSACELSQQQRLGHQESQQQLDEPKRKKKWISNETPQQLFNGYVKYYRKEIDKFNRKNIWHVKLEDIVKKTVPLEKVKSKRKWDKYSTRTILSDVDYKDLVLYWPKFFTPDENMFLKQYTSAIATVIPFTKCNQQRHEHEEVDVDGFEVPKVGTFHAAYWYEKGQAKSKDKTVLGSKLHYSQEILNCRTMKIAAVLKAFDPCVYDLYLERLNKLLNSNVENKLGFGQYNPFSGRAFNINQQSTIHRDLYDCALGWTALHCFGSFSNGNFRIPLLNACFDYNAGDLILFRSSPLHHFVDKWEGESRYSIVHFFHQSLIDDIKVNGIDDPLFVAEAAKFLQKLEEEGHQLEYSLEQEDK